jgi:hypothetical protein
LNNQIRTYDGFLFGNGLSLNFISQLQPKIPTDKQYLLQIDDFLIAFLNGQLSPREENRIFKLFYKNKDTANLDNFNKLKEAFTQFYKAHDADIEFWFGFDLLKQVNTLDYDFPTMKSFFPFMYNIWHEIRQEYLIYLNLNKCFENFEKSIRSYLDRDARIFTTNFDRLFEGLSPTHIHGIFVKDLRKAEELIFTYISKESFYYKCLWGWNGIGKLHEIYRIQEIPGYEKYFDFNFFFDNNIHMNNLLIYGIGFQTSGYEKKLSESMSKYKNPSVGGIVDEHILIRLKGMQNQDQLKRITFAYYSDCDFRHYEYLSNYFELQ